MEDPVFIDASEDRATLVADSLATKNESCTSERIEKIQSAKVNESESDVNEDFEIVPQEDSSEESDESGESDKDEDDSVKTSNSSSDDEISEIDKSKLEVYKGLKAFGGIQSPKKEKNRKHKEKTDKKQESVVQSKNKMKLDEKPAKATDEGSDSDSDYDFFAVSKVDIKTSQADKSEKKHTEDESKLDTKILTQSGNHENPFQNALQNAIVQDEMVIPSSVTQIYILAPMKLRLITLSALIIERCVTPGSGKMLVFMATQDMIDYHCEILSRILAGRKPHHIHIEDNNKFSKRNKKYSKHKDTSAEESHDKEKDKELDKSKETEDGQRESKDSGDEYEYKFDSMDLADYEAKMRAEKAFVNVDFFQLHGSMNQKTRTEIFNTFRKANSGVLLCTDVAARGLDLPHVDCIVQYTGPISVTDYVHRVGRTARAGNVGVAIMILLPSELEFVKQLEARRIRLYQEDMEVSHKALLRNSEDRNRNSKSGGPSAVQVAAATLQQNYEELVKSDQQLYTKACKAFTSWLRFYSTYPREAREAFDRTALHIGHAATALALTDTPKKIGREAPKPVNRKESDLKRRAEKEKKLPKMAVKARRRERKMIINEFDSGLEPSKKKSRYH